MVDDNRITKWLSPETIDNGKYGKITNHQWLEKEFKRFTDMGDNVEILANKNSEALFRISL